jgi:hypothetical protein
MQINTSPGCSRSIGTDEMIKEVREEIGKGADVIKLYADYQWAAGGRTAPTLTLDEHKNSHSDC